MGARARGDRGGIAAGVAVMPTVFTLFFAIIQISLWYHGRSVATAGAHHALEAARAYESTAGAGEAAGEQFIGQVGGLDASTVNVVRGAETVTVTVDADAISVVPGMQKHITIVLEGPVERIVE